MKKVLLTLPFLLIAGCLWCGPKDQEDRDQELVKQQQEQYAHGQPVPTFDWSLERQTTIELYKARNKKVATHAVWRSEMGTIEGDCPSIGFGLPYDTSLTNPLQGNWIWSGGGGHVGIAVIGQAEPNGVFASTNTSATWVLCTDDTGATNPVYIEAKVTVYPYAVTVDYEKNRVTRAGTQGFTIEVGQTK